MSYRSMRMVLPVGWKLRDQGYRACLDPVGAGGCTAEVVVVEDLVSQAGGSRPTVSAADGWVFTPDDRACPDGPAVSTRTEARSLSLASGPASYGRWRVACPGGALSPRLWLLAGGRVAVRQRVSSQAADLEVDRLVASIRTG